MSDQGEFLSAREAADVIGISVVTVARLARAGAIEPVHKFPGLRGARVFHRDEVNRVADERGIRHGQEVIPEAG